MPRAVVEGMQMRFLAHSDASPDEWNAEEGYATWDPTAQRTNPRGGRRVLRAKARRHPVSPAIAAEAAALAARRRALGWDVFRDNGPSSRRRGRR